MVGVGVGVDDGFTLGLGDGEPDCSVVEEVGCRAEVIALEFKEPRPSQPERLKIITDKKAVPAAN